MGTGKGTVPYDSRVASLTNGRMVFTHDDHLGGLNVVTDIVGKIEEGDSPQMGTGQGQI